MDVASNVVLITGGASGIGLALACHFLDSGSEVIVCGRREEQLKEAKAKYPRLEIRVCDVSKPAERVALDEFSQAFFIA